MTNQTSTTTDTTFVDIANSRKEDQRAIMERIVEEGHCPFCLDNLRLYHQAPILKDGDFWILTPNQWPYENTQHHLLAISKTHIENLSEISPAAAGELFAFFAEYIVQHDIPGGGFAMRFGDTNYSAGTVKHLHAQFIIPDIHKADFKPVRFKIGKDLEKRR